MVIQAPLLKSFCFISQTKILASLISLYLRLIFELHFIKDGSFYTTNEITCFGELEMIGNRHISIEKCVAPKLSISKIVFFCSLILYANIYFIVDNEETAVLLTRILNTSPHLSKVYFEYISDSGLMHLSASQCALSLRTID